ncbi:VCBS repeat-containing protein [Agriterribacter sp.]|uniref:VCBS repeat-containing protein n=1 Tax=Agriterribacter sp. TaxID=2821509 RepID=UPI002B512347|nr:VCBS repeat-containing protein [Agriterribacter sp.]HRP57475.1 VCBS repeat-containing protein [Agriterribacter sp.]
MRFPLAFSYLMLCFTACKQHAREDHLLELMPVETTGIDFQNEIHENEQFNVLRFEYFYNGAGVGVGDFNKDGLQDVFFTSNMGRSRLYINEGAFRFKDITGTSGINTAGKWASGVSVVDINQDSLPDLYVCFAGPHEAAQRANALYINNGDNTFTDKARAYGLADTGHSVQSVFFDYDRDGDLDMYLLTNITDEMGPNVIRKKRIHGEMPNTDRLYRNNGNGTFTNVSQQAGITVEGYGLGVSACDINDDGWPDIYVSNDYVSDDLLYINNRDGTFTDRAAAVFKHTSYSAMGNDIADYNNDGRPDIYTVDMLPPDNYRKKMMIGATPNDRHRSEIQYGYAPQFMRNTLQLNRGMDKDSLPSFSETGQLAGVDATDWSWSALWADLDNDGWRDLIVTNGYPRDVTNRDFINYNAQALMKGYADERFNKHTMAALRELDGAFLHNFVFQNRGDLTFEDQSANWGFTRKAYSTGAAYADLDNDGDLDIIISNTYSPASIYRNNAGSKTQNHYLKIGLSGPPGNIQGYGTKLKLFAGGLSLYHEHFPARGYQSTVDATVHFGLGKQTGIDSLNVIWPDGKTQTLHAVGADQVLQLHYANSTVSPAHMASPGTTAIFRPANAAYNIHYRHTETPYTDFNIQPLLPHKFSQNGPGIAVADINGDGRDDFFAGGAYNQSGQLFFQQPNGSFITRSLVTGKKYEEDMGVLFFDADNDGDQDLYIVSGGNEFAAGSPYYQDRLYINDGKGNFALKPDALPEMHTSGSCVIAADFDRDGDLDLFTGGWLTPQHYPAAGVSMLLENRNGVFVDVTEEKAPGLKDIGMVTAALWTDVNNDNQMDLLIVGEWMPVTLFINHNGTFSNGTQQGGLLHTVGWWNSIQAADFDQDGRTDYILGNLGLNSRFRTSEKDPLRMYTYDHDVPGGTTDAIISYSLNGVSYPVHPRDDVMQRMPFLKKEFPLYKDYANAKMEDLFPPAALSKTKVAHTFQTAYLRNNGAQGWKLEPLCVEAQFAPVFGMLAGDYDEDGFADVLLTGNWYATEVISGQYDASKGLFLKGNGKGGFSVKENGFRVEGDAKGLAEIRTQKNTLLLSAMNNDSLAVLEEKPRSALQPFVVMGPRDAYAVISLNNGKQVKQEFYYGSGYFSQTGRYLRIPPGAVSVTVYDFKGEKREWSGLPARLK